MNDLEKKAIKAAIEVFEWNGTPVVLKARKDDVRFSSDFSALGIALFNLNEFNNNE